MFTQADTVKAPDGTATVDGDMPYWPEPLSFQRPGAGVIQGPGAGPGRRAVKREVVDRGRAAVVRGAAAVGPPVPPFSRHQSFGIASAVAASATDPATFTGAETPPAVAEASAAGR